jgi:E3 ubiquitin-protein ligase listerin
MHHLPALFLHPSRKLRLLAAGLHISLVHIHPIRDAMLLFLRETASQDQLESILGAWCLASHDVERPVAIEASKSWADAFSHPLAQNSTLTLLAFVQRTLMDPLGVYLYLNPVPVDIPLSQTHPKGTHRSPALIRRDTPESSTRAKVEGDEEDEQDRKARLRIGAFGAIKWILGASIQPKRRTR